MGCQGTQVGGGGNSNLETQEVKYRQVKFEKSFQHSSRNEHQTLDFRGHSRAKHKNGDVLGTQIVLKVMKWEEVIRGSSETERLRGSKLDAENSSAQEEGNQDSMKDTLGGETRGRSRYQRKVFKPSSKMWFDHHIFGKAEVTEDDFLKEDLRKMLGIYFCSGRMFMLKPPLTTSVMEFLKLEIPNVSLKWGTHDRFLVLTRKHIRKTSSSPLFENVVRWLSISQEPNRMLFYATVKTLPTTKHIPGLPDGLLILYIFYARTLRSLLERGHYLPSSFTK